MKTLREELKDWTNWDQAELIIAKSLSIVKTEAEMELSVKGIFWSSNPMGNFLADVLEQMADLGVLELIEEPDLQYRWNRDFKGEWE